MSETQPDTNGATPTVVPETQPRGDNGQFQPKAKEIPPSEPTPDPPKPKNNKTVNALLDEIEKELCESLKGVNGLKDITALESQDTRVRMLRILSKNVKTQGVKTIVDPTASPPPSAKPAPKTIMDMNRADEFNRDVMRRKSFLMDANKLRGKK